MPCVYLGDAAALLSVSKSISPTPPSLLLQFETGVREAGDGEDRDPETLRDGERRARDTDTQAAVVAAG